MPKYLDDNCNYWTVVVAGTEENGKYYVYDCKKNAVISLVTMSKNSFFIIDKKYKWLVCFESTIEEQIIISKSGYVQTPFDKKINSL